MGAQVRGWLVDQEWLRMWTEKFVLIITYPCDAGVASCAVLVGLTPLSTAATYLGEQRYSLPGRPCGGAHVHF